MVSKIIVEETDGGISLIEVGIQGPAGPKGSTAPHLMGTVSMSSASDVKQTLIASARYGFTIAGLYGLGVSSGTTTLTVKINDVAVTGLDGITVGNTPQDVLATGNNVVEVGDKLGFELSGGGSATDFEFTMGATPA